MALVVSPESKIAESIVNKNFMSLIQEEGDGDEQNRDYTLPIKGNSIIVQRDFPRFMGSRIFVNQQTRNQLPVLKPDAPFPIWDIIKKVIKSPDIMRVSLPVIINEPLSGCQRNNEALCSSAHIFEAMAVCEDSIKRLALLCLGGIAPLNTMKYRVRKPFNPMLYETHEFVTEKYRCLTEKVEHEPRQIMNTYIEGEHYKFWCFSWPKPPMFRFNGGRGMFEIKQLGCTDYYAKKFNEHYSIGKPTLYFKNIIFGNVCVDCGDDNLAINHMTKETALVRFFEKTSNDKPSYIEVDLFDANKQKVAELRGSWQSEINYIDLRTGKTEKVWEEYPLVENAHMQYFFMPLSVQLNDFQPEMKGFIPITDSRYRKDLRYFEDDRIDDSEVEKEKIEMR